jgi:glycine/D-amino acid oxidase-like deaminating enzyme
VIVVGAGIVGAACAAALARAGLRVLVLEAAIAGAGTTAAAMGHLVVMDDSPAQLALTRLGVSLWRGMLPDLPRNVEFESRGTIWIAESDEQTAAIEAKRALYVANGVEALFLDAAQLAREEPHLRAGLAGGLLVPGDAVLYPPTAALHLLAVARAHGAEVREGTQVSSVAAGEVRLGAEILRADAVVNAAGANAAALTPGLPIVPRKGHLAITERYPGFVNHQLVELGYLASAHGMSAESVAFNVQPRSTGQVLIGSSRELVGWNREMNRSIVKHMLARARSFMPGLGDLQVIRTWTGFRPATPDSLPLIGPWAQVPGLWIAAGHEGLGITTALATAEIVVAGITGASAPVDPRPYLPSRIETDAAPAAHVA